MGGRDGRMMCISDFPMDAGLQDQFPRRQEICAYYEAYVHHFELAQYIRFGTKVISVSREASCWAVRVSTNEDQQEDLRFDAVFVCTGQFREPEIPQFPTTMSFKGSISHAS